MGRLIMLAGILACVSCNGSTLTGPPNFAGNWAGAISGTRASDGTLALTLTQQPLILTPPGTGTQDQLEGTWAATFSDEAADGGGTASGDARNSSVSLTLTPGAPGQCAYELTGTLTSTTTMQGTYRTSSCTTPDTGTFAVTKQ
ncbi:MAG: hypothetical protein WBQ26_01390 [Gemmatimonadaceae bacterium]